MRQKTRRRMGAGFVLTVAGCMAFTLWNVIPIYSMWRRRHELLVKARGPYHTLCYCSAYFLLGEVVWIQELLRQKGVIMPSSVVMWTTALTLPLMFILYAVRSARILIISSSTHRKSLLKYLSLENQLALLTAYSCFTVALEVVLVVNRGQGVFSHLDYNFLFEPALVNLIAFGVFTVPVAKCCLLLFALKDTLKVGIEICKCIISISVVMVPYLLILTLHSFGVIEDLDTRVQFMIVISVTHINYESLIASRRMWAKGRPRSDRVDAVSNFTTSVEGGMRGGGITSISLLASPDLCPMYSKFVERNLCFESSSFLIDTLKYKADAVEGVDDIDKQFQDFSEIVSQYMMPGSILEINVGAAIEHRVLAKSKERVYKALSKVERATIFDESMKEVGRLLDQNLLVSFMNSQEYRIAVATSASSPRATSFKTFLKTAISMHSASPEATSLVEVASELEIVKDLL